MRRSGGESAACYLVRKGRVACRRRLVQLLKCWMASVAGIERILVLMEQNLSEPVADDFWSRICGGLTGGCQRLGQEQVLCCSEHSQSQLSTVEQGSHDLL